MREVTPQAPGYLLSSGDAENYMVSLLLRRQRPITEAEWDTVTAAWREHKASVERGRETAFLELTGEDLAFARAYHLEQYAQAIADVEAALPIIEYGAFVAAGLVAEPVPYTEVHSDR